MFPPRRLLSPLLLAPAMLAPPVAAPSPPGPPHYVATRLATLPRQFGCAANAINDRGVIVGVSEDSHKHAVKWVGPVVRDLGRLSDSDSAVAVAVNDAGVAVGYAEQSGKPRACRFEGDSVKDLGSPGEESRATCVNDRGDVGGWAEKEASLPHAILWRGARRVDLGRLGGIQAWCTAITDSGLLLGYVNPPGPGSGHLRPFFWRAGKTTEIPVLPGYDDVETHGTNAHGDLVGAALRKSGTPAGVPAHAFLWRGGKLLDLGTLGGAYSRAYAVNNRGQVVGVSTLSDGRSHAFLWESGHLFDLNRCIRSNSGWSLDEARGINNRGEIVGAGIYQGQRRAFALAPGTRA